MFLILTAQTQQMFLIPTTTTKQCLSRHIINLIEKQKQIRRHKSKRAKDSVRFDSIPQEYNIKPYVNCLYIKYDGEI